MASSSPSFPGSPRAVSTGLFAIAPDRDERMQQVAMEMLLTCHQNGYEHPADAPLSPRRSSLLLRGLVLGEDFVAGGRHEEQYEPLASKLAAGADFSASEGMKTIQASLGALLDPATIHSSLGTHLMLPVHQSLLWYDTRRRSKNWDAQFVLMRGTGITLARFLLAPPETVADQADEARRALEGIRDALGARSPYGPTIEALASLPDTGPAPMNDPEREAWNAAEKPQLAALGSRLIRHTAAIMADERQPPEVRLLHLRRIIALDVAWHMLHAAWEASGTAADDRCLVVCHAPQERAQNRARVMSEASFTAARQALSRGVVAELRSRMDAYRASGASWEGSFFLTRTADQKPTPTSEYYKNLTNELDEAGGDIDLDVFASRAYDAPGDGYSRPIGAFRVMIESCGLLRGTGRYRYLRAVPALMAAMVSARPQSVEQEADEFFRWLREEWSIIIGEDEAKSSALRGEGSVLKRNAAYFERDLVDAGLATALSDQTTMVAMKR